MNWDGSGKSDACAGVNLDRTGLLGAWCGSTVHGRPAWSPDEHEIAFARDRSIGILDLDGRHRDLLSKKIKPANVDWSPDGKRLVFDEPSTGLVHVVNADGTGLRLVARQASKPRWSEDGAAILYIGKSGSINEIRLSGGAPRTVKLGGKQVRAADADWSPDGNRIAYINLGHDLHILDLRSGKDRTIDLRRGVCAPGACQSIDWEPTGG